MRRLVLWDVDGTLVWYDGLGREAFADAFLAVMGRPASDAAQTMIRTAGRTDPDIAVEFLAMHDIPDVEARLGTFTTALERALAAKEAVMRERRAALPGVRETLIAVRDQPGVVQSLLTGNLQANAVLKLAAAGLDGYVDFEVGAFGSDHRERPRLVEVARAKMAAKYGVELDPRSIVVIGDTPLDVAAGRAGGARTVAVASGPFDLETLRQTGADAVLPDLLDPTATLTAILADP